MPTSGPHRSPEPNPTRQMLDELDALMEKMLALPVNELEEAPQASPPPVSAGLAVEAPPMPVAETPPPALPEPPVPARIWVGRTGSYTLEDDVAVTAPAPPTLEFVAPQPPSLPSFRKDPPAPLDEILPPLIIKPPAMTKPPQRPRRRSLAGSCLQSLLWINKAYDRATFSLGDAGKWLRSARGRTVIGSAGLVLLALGGLWWLHDLLGWTWLGDPLE